MINNACVLITRPKGDEISTHGIRTAWAMFSAALDPQILLLEDGVFNAFKNPCYNTSLLEDYLKEGGVVSCYQEDLETRGLKEDQLLEGIEVVDRDRVSEIIEECDGVFSC